MDTDPEFLTLGAAARACNRSKATISRAVRSGRLPAKAAADNAGGWLIRREDLDRVFPQQSSETVAGRSRRPHGDVADRHQIERLWVEVEGLRERLQGTEHRLADATATIADLRGERDRLLGVIETQAQQMKQLTDQRPPRRRRWWPWG